MSHWHAEGWIQIRDILIVLPLSFLSCVESCLLVLWCVSGRCDIAGSDEDHDRSRRSGAEDRGWLHRSGTRWPDDQEVRWHRVRSALYTWRRGAKSQWRFYGLGLKIKQASVCRLRHKTDRGKTTRDTHRDLSACFAWKQVMLGFPSMAIRLVDKGRVVHMASSRRLHQVEAEDRRVDTMGCIGPFYPKIVVSSVLGLRGIVVF
jgi:hypothetical protein